MASESDVARVKLLLEGVDDVWDDTKIESVLDSAGSVAKTMQAFWQAKVNATYRLVDVQESGSSRSLSTAYRNAQEQLQRWDAEVVKEAQEVADPPSGIRIGRITRKMPL